MNIIDNKVTSDGMCQPDAGHAHAVQFHLCPGPFPAKSADEVLLNNTHVQTISYESKALSTVWSFSKVSATLKKPYKSLRSSKSTHWLTSNGTKQLEAL